MKTPLVSILMPFKNTEEFLPECINSILGQSYKNWELLIVDDHSTDDSCEIVAKFARNDGRIVLLKNDYSGIISALNKAYKASSGQFITRMDSDDIMDKDKLQLMSNDLLTSGPGNIALGLVKYFNKNGLKDGYRQYETWLNDLTKSGSNFSEIYKECVIPSPCWMIHREDLVKCEAFNHNEYPEDYDLAFRFYKFGLKCIPSKQLLHYWRDYDTRTSRTDENYAQNSFIDLKLNYFLNLDHDVKRPLTIWGAGNKGKSIAKRLIEKEVNFTWICNNPKKIGKHIYGVELFNFKEIEKIKFPQCIVSVANKEAQKEIREYFMLNHMVSMHDYFFFC